MHTPLTLFPFHTSGIHSTLPDPSRSPGLLRSQQRAFLTSTVFPNKLTLSDNSDQLFLDLWLHLYICWNEYFLLPKLHSWTEHKNITRLYVSRIIKLKSFKSQLRFIWTSPLRLGEVDEWFTHKIHMATNTLNTPTQNFEAPIWTHTRTRVNTPTHTHIYIYIYLLSIRHHTPCLVWFYCKTPTTPFTILLNI